MYIKTSTDLHTNELKDLCEPRQEFDDFLYEPTCEHPVFIVNPSLDELLMRGYTLHNGSTTARFCSRSASVLKSFRSKLKIKPSYSVCPSIKDYYLVDEDTGEIVPLYVAVPCGHCPVCKGIKVNSFVHRCKLESLSYSCLPWFVTLTYDDGHYPACGLSKRDAQLFLKRLRINLTRRGYQDKIRYVLVGEYGKNTHRGHYHAIFWNLHSTEILTSLEISKIIEKSWSNGYILSRQVDLSNERCFYYTAKYLRKDCVKPFEDAEPPFCLEQSW